MDNGQPETRGDGMANPPDFSANDNLQRVEAERVGTGEEQRPFAGYHAEGPGGIRVAYFSHASGGIESVRPPIVSAWICLALAWLFLGSRVPFTVFLGIPLDLAALFLGTICLSRGALFTGLGVLILGTAGSLIVYLVGVFRFLLLLGNT